MLHNEFYTMNILNTRRVFKKQVASLVRRVCRVCMKIT